MNKHNIVANHGKFIRGIETTGAEFTDNVVLANNKFLTGTNYAGSGTIAIIGLNEDDEIEMGGTLIIEPIAGPVDGGRISLFNMPVSDAPDAGSEMSATMKIGDDNVFTFGAEADSSGGIQNPFIAIHNISEHADNAAAIASGLTAGKAYRTGDILKIVH